jgi:hypothetical protein
MGGWATGLTGDCASPGIIGRSTAGAPAHLARRLLVTLGHAMPVPGRNPTGDEVHA